MDFTTASGIASSSSKTIHLPVCTGSGSSTQLTYCEQEAGQGSWVWVACRQQMQCAHATRQGAAHFQYPDLRHVMAMVGAGASVQEKCHQIVNAVILR